MLINKQIDVVVRNKGMLEECESTIRAATSLKIDTDSQYENAGKFTLCIRSLYNKVNEERINITKPLDEAKKEVMDIFRIPLEQLESAKKIVDSALANYHLQKQKEIKEAEEKAVEHARLEEEKKKKALEEKAIKAEASGNELKAEILREKAEILHVPVIHKPMPIAPKVSGISMRTTWKAKVVDFKKIPANFYINDPKVQSAISSVMDALAKATKGGIGVDGVIFEQITTTAGRVSNV